MPCYRTAKPNLVLPDHLQPVEGMKVHQAVAVSAAAALTEVLLPPMVDVKYSSTMSVMSTNPEDVFQDSY